MNSPQTAGVEVWGGIECTLNRVGDRWFDQVERTGHAERASDIELIASLGVSAVRYPVLWERIAPSSLDALDWTWTDQRFRKLREFGVRPIAGLLHHGSGPGYTSLLDPNFPELLAQFATQVATRYPWLTDYTPINEPLTTARFSALYGFWYPHERSDRTFVRALLTQARGIVLAMQAIRRINPAARLMQTEDCGKVFGTPETARQVQFENHRRWLTCDLLTGAVDQRHPLRSYLLKHGARPEELEFFQSERTPPDVVGLNYYITSDRYLDHRLGRYPASSHGGNGRVEYADVEAVRAREEGIVGHHAHLMEAWHRYELPVALTEIHLACTREEQIRWLLEASRGAATAREQGANVVAITPWSLLGAYDWDSLVTEPRGHYEPGAFDVRAPRPRPTRLAATIRELACGAAPAPDDGPDAPGWWRRLDRLLYREPRPIRSAPPVGPGAPVLVLGSTGTLGSAFQRICEGRGLSVCAVGREDFDLAHPDSITSLFAAFQPWAVVNATGFVRVDDAERETDACFGVNTVGATNIALACMHHAVPLVSFSSDLVFDGALGRPYVESDRPRPLNVYGASKAEAEVRIHEVMPRALVIRTSAFFGPWDSHNFVVDTLRAIRQGRRVRAADDLVVSPTYVPDLVNTTLDLLIDDETGLWHLANGGATTWFALARRAAEACGERADLIEPAQAADLGWLAARPAYSALTSERGNLMRSHEEALAAFAEHHQWREQERLSA
ncbi:MAG: sugar nucleotide-binding protein [Vicinamibacterales bacterium]